MQTSRYHIKVILYLIRLEDFLRRTPQSIATISFDLMKRKLLLIRHKPFLYNISHFRKSPLNLIHGGRNHSCGIPQCCL